MSDDSAEFDYARRDQSVWKENHGNVLLGLTLLIAALGCCIIAYRQLRFVKPTFPSSEAFPNPTDTVESGLAVTPGGADPSNGTPISQAQLTQALLVTTEPIVTISVTGVTNDSGAMMLAIYESAETFNDPTKTQLKGLAAIINGITKVRIPWSSLPPEFAVSAYHDENADGKLNKGPLGAPTEKYGFSNQARGLLGAPSFGQAVVKRPEKNGEIKIIVK